MALQPAAYERSLGSAQNCTKAAVRVKNGAGPVECGGSIIHRLDQHSVGMFGVLER